MELNENVLDFLKNNNIITTRQFVNLGLSNTTLSNYVKNGLLEKCSHGIYTLPDSLYDDIYVLMLCSDKIIFSHESALFLNGLSNRTPFIHSITLSSHSSIPSSIRKECNCYYVKDELYTLGLIEKKTTFGHYVRCYDVERTICDMIRSRNRLDEELVISAIKNYANYEEKDLNKLAKYAVKFKVDKILKRYLEVLL